MTKSGVRFKTIAGAAAWLPAVVVPWLALWLATAGQGPARIAVSPFGWDRLIAVHVLATLPVTWIVARWMRRRLPRPGRGSAAAWAAIGIVIAVATCALGSLVGPVLDEGNAGMILRLAWRIGWCAALELPWCLMAEAIGFAEAPSDTADDWQHRRRVMANFALAMLVAVGLPASFTADLVRRQTTAANDMLQRQRVAKAAPVIAALRDVGSDKPVANQSPAVCLRQLMASISRLEVELARPMVSPLAAEATIQRAAALAMLDRLPEATHLVEPLSPRHPQAALLLAAIWQQREDWQASSDQYRHALELLDATPAAGVQSTMARVRAYNGIAFNSRELQLYQEAEATYLEGLRSVPAAQAHFHFQLGLHYQLAGRPLKSAEHLQAAAQIDPANYAASAATVLRKLNLETPGCGFRPTWAPAGQPLSR